MPDSGTSKTVFFCRRIFPSYQYMFPFDYSGPRQRFVSFFLDFSGVSVKSWEMQYLAHHSVFSEFFLSYQNLLVSPTKIDGVEKIMNIFREKQREVDRENSFESRGLLKLAVDKYTSRGLVIYEGSRELSHRGCDEGWCSVEFRVMQGSKYSRKKVDDGTRNSLILFSSARICGFFIVGSLRVPTAMLPDYVAVVCHGPISRSLSIRFSCFDLLGVWRYLCTCAVSPLVLV